MKRWTRDFKLIPLVLLATICLFALKVSGLIFDGGYTLGERLGGANKSDLTLTTADTIPDVTPIIRAVDAPVPRQPWAKEMFNFGGDKSDVTGSVGASKPPEKPAETTKDLKEVKAVDPPKDPGGTLVPTGPQGIMPAGERAILERLQDRRQQLDARNRELDMREGLLQAAEKRLEARLNELKAVESRIGATVKQREQDEVNRFKGVVTMYENMKAKEASRVFDRLDIKILVELAGLINPRKMSEILAQMSPEAAERLTVEIANRAAAQKSQSADALPQIEGKQNPR
jgi:flagellar motility protein MotE (MotC chaperone)